MRFDRIAILDWSAANQPRQGRDSIWLGLADEDPVNLPTRAEAARALQALIAQTLLQGQRLLIGADFAFGFPQGFAEPLTGQASALAVWDWLSAHLTDDHRNRSNRFDLAGRANAAFPGLGPFWFTPPGTDIPGLPARGRERHGHGLPERRLCDSLATGAQSVWKLGGVGAVGSQTLTGLPRLEALRRTFPGAVSVWPFEAPVTPIVLAEVFPSLLAAEVRAATHPGTLRDALQVSLLSRALAGLGDLAALFAPPPGAALAEEGWILGLGHQERLRAALL